MTEARAISQHPMHDDGELACQRHLGFLHSAPPGDLHRPALQCRAALEWLGQNDVGALVQSGAHPGITDFRDAAIDVCLARLIFGRVRPNKAPTCFDDLKRAGSSIAAIKVSDTMAPTPGIDINK